jgi:hypothetical protein
MSLRTVAVLFARADSIYKTLEGCDVWDAERDARKWPGGAPIVGHPPCRAWGQLRHFAKPRPDEKELATWCIDRIREEGGVLEHPIGSTLWPVKGLPEPGHRDQFGGWTYQAPQQWWGHLAEKWTRFYIVGIEPHEMPTVPLVLGEAERTMSGVTKEDLKKPGARPELLKKDREKTPPALAEWLVELARRTRKPRIS